MGSTLGNNLVDDLVPVVDSLRADLYDSMGTRQHEVRLVRRRWTGVRRNEGTVSETSNVLIAPPPLLKLPDNQGGEHWAAEPQGRDDQGNMVLSEVSLTYTESDLTGGLLQGNEDFYYRVADLRGQGIALEYYVPVGRPRTDREKNIGWVVQLQRCQVEQAT